MKTMALKRPNRIDDVDACEASVANRLTLAPTAAPRLVEDDLSLHSIVRATHGLQAWLHDLDARGLSRSTESPRIVVIDEAAAARFCLGIMDGRTFFGVQKEELHWFGGLPWFHVALRKGSNRLNFVCEQTSVGKMTFPAFALAFLTQSPGRLIEISRLQRLDIRPIEIDDAGRVQSVSRDRATTVDIQIVESDETLDGLMAGRLMTGHTNRSAIRSTKT